MMYVEDCERAMKLTPETHKHGGSTGDSPHNLRAFLSLGLCLFCLMVLLATAEAQTARNQSSGPTRRATGALKVVTGRPFSYVFINNVLHGATKDDGELNLARVWAGSFPIRVRTAGFVDWTAT